jgi:hypothetical protein
MENWVGTGISIVALTLSAITAWLTWFQRGKLMMTQPTTIFFGPDGSHFESRINKIYLRTLLYSSSRRGQVVESMHVTLSRGETKQNFSIWVHGHNNELSRGSGLFVAHEGISMNHHFLLPPDGSDFKFLPGKYNLSVWAKLVSDSTLIQLKSISLEITESQSKSLEDPHCGLYFDWGPDQNSYYAHLDQKPENPI